MSGNNPNSNPRTAIIVAIIGAIGMSIAAIINATGNCLSSGNCPPPPPPPPPTTTTTTTSSSPLVILLDNSGSMGRCSITTEYQGGNKRCDIDAEIPYRIDVVKKVLIKRIQAKDLGSDRIGLVEFGNWKSYGSLRSPSPIPDSADSYLKCQAVKTLVNVDVNSQEDLIKVLSGDKIMPNDSGATPIAFAISSVVHTILEPKGLLPARILLITDGQPNCSDEQQINFCDIIAGLESKNIKLNTEIVGYKADGIDPKTNRRGDQEFIDCVKKHSKSLRYLGSANTEDDLLNKVDRVLSYSQH